MLGIIGSNHFESRSIITKLIPYLNGGCTLPHRKARKNATTTVWPVRNRGGQPLSSAFVDRLVSKKKKCSNLGIQWSSTAICVSFVILLSITK